MGTNKQYFIGELSALTGVKAGTIRFYETCGFWRRSGERPTVTGFLMNTIFTR